MARSAVVFVCLALAFAISAVESSAVPVKVEVVQSLAEYLEANPSVALLEPLIKEPLASDGTSKLGITYKQGGRIRGDALVATDSNSANWNKPQDVKTALNYPKNGVGAVVTYVQVDVEQSTNLGQAYVTSGGVGQRQITLVVEAKQTLYFRYKAYIYGYY